MNLKQKVRDVVNSHNLMHIASIDQNGNPCVRGVDYANGEQENVLYFITHKTTRKVQQIKDNENVSVVIDHDCPSWDDLSKLRYIKGSGTATIVENPVEAQQAMGMIMQKFPFLKDLPGEPTDFVAVRVELNEVFVTDNTVSFGHTEAVNY